MIKPTVGRIVWFYVLDAYECAEDLPITYSKPGEPMAAIVAHVINDSRVNLSVFDQKGKQFNVTSVPLFDEVPELVGYSFYATWPLAQKEHAAKAEALELQQANAPTSGSERAFIIRDFVAQMLHNNKDVWEIEESVPRLLALLVDKPMEIKAKLSTIKHSAPPVDPIEQEIQAKGLTAPRVTPADVEANIASEHFFTAADAIDAGIVVGYKYPGSLDLLTICVLTLQNGFTVTGESACASPENFDAEIGRKTARENAVQKIWPLMGYELKQRLYEQRVIEPGRAEVVATWIDHNNNRIRHGVECDISEIQDSCIHLERYVNNWQENALKEHATGFQAITTEGT